MVGFRFCRTTALLLTGLLAFAVASGCARAKSDDSLLELDRLVAEESTEVSVFYPSADIIAEEKLVLDEKDSLPLEAMRALFKAEPQDPDLRVTLPKATVNAVEIREGVAWVDFGSDVIVTGEGTRTQQVALAAIVYTLKQFDGVKQVAFTVEGKTDGVVDGKDVAAFWGDVRLDQQPWDVSSKRTSEEGMTSK